MPTLTKGLAVMAVCAIGTALAGSARADAIFDFTDPQFGQGLQGPMQIYTFGSKSLTVHAYSTIFLPPGGGIGLPADPAIISNGAGGLGVVGDGSNNQVDNFDDPVDGAGDTGIFEWLALSTTTGKIGGLDLRNLTGGEEADLWRATAPDGTPGTFVFLGTVNGVTPSNPQFAPVDLMGDEYLLVSPGNTLTGFRVERVHIVPEPATIAVFGLGLAGLGFMRRRRKA